MNELADCMTEDFDESTVTANIFGRVIINSEVTCLDCSSKSAKSEPFMDISLQIKGASTVNNALTNFLKPERMEGNKLFLCVNSATWRLKLTRLFRFKHYQKSSSYS